MKLAVFVFIGVLIHSIILEDLLRQVLCTVTTTTGNDSKTEHEIVNFVDRVTGTLDKTLLNTLDKTLTRQGNGTLKDIITETVQGIKPYQELIQLQRDIAMFNLYDYITADFKCNFCLLIY